MYSRTFIGLTISDGSSLKLYANTKAGLHYPSGVKLSSSLTKFCTYKSVVLKNEDVCLVGNWVLIQSNDTCPAICHIEEILSPLDPDGQTPQYASAVLLRGTIVMGIADTYHMPRVRLKQDEFFLRPLEVGTWSS